MNYSELQSEVGKYLHRTDLTAQIPTFIGIAESYLFRELHIKELQVSVAGSTAGEYATLPADFGSVSRVVITYGGKNYTLDYLAVPESYTAIDPCPAYYSFENNQIRIWGAGTGQTYTLSYIPAVAPLTNSNPTNWILENASDLYLYASALEGARYVRNQAEIDKLTPLILASLDSVKRFTERRGQPATGSLQIKPRRG